MGVAFFLAFSGLFVITVLLVLLLRAVPVFPSSLPTLRHIPHLYALRRKRSQLENSTDHGPPVPNHWLTLFYLDSFPADARLMKSVANHNQSVLSALAKRVAASEETLTTLRVLEALLNDRLQLVRSDGEIEEQISQIKSDPAKRAWALKEFDRKQDAVREKLRSNLRTIEHKLEDLVATRQNSSESPIYYH